MCREKGAKEPVIREISLQLSPPHLDDQRADDVRLREELAKKLGQWPRLPLSVLRKLTRVLREGNFSLRTVLGYDGAQWEVLDVHPLGHHSPLLGLGVDLGSTSVVLYLYDFRQRKVVRKHSFKNPQIVYGEDILTRLHYADKPERRHELHTLIVDKLKREIRHLLDDLSSENIYYMALCGNTTMVHFFLDLETRYLYREPYLPATSWVDLLKARDLGLPAHQEAFLFVFPNAGSYFGGDLLSGIMASGLHKQEGFSILIDVGTNAEVVLGNKDFLLACAGAAGPALEGGILKCGMQAAEGAIERVRIDPQSLELSYDTIGNAPPVGICGSGVIDLLAQMFLAGLLDQRGKFVPSRLPERFCSLQGEPAFIVAFEDETGHGRPIYITQGEVKSVIRSKGAMYTILTVLCNSVGLSLDQIERFFIAGSFGHYIDPEMAVTIGMLPDVPLERFVSLGNAAGKGTVKFLEDRASFQELRQILERLTYMEMNVRGEFMYLLTGALFLPHTDWSLFPRVRKKLSKPQ